MASLNECSFIGNLGADPESRTMQNGGKVVSLRLACTERWRDKQSGEVRERTDWIPVVIFNEGLADIAEKYLRKGSRCFVQGAFQTRKWQDKDGNDRYSTEIVLKRFQGKIVLLDSKAEKSGDDFSKREYEQASGGTGGRGDLDDEIPF